MLLYGICSGKKTTLTVTLVIYFNRKWVVFVMKRGNGEDPNAGQQLGRRQEYSNLKVFIKEKAMKVGEQNRRGRSKTRWELGQNRQPEAESGENNMDQKGRRARQYIDTGIMRHRCKS